MEAAKADHHLLSARLPTNVRSGTKTAAPSNFRKIVSTIGGDPATPFVSRSTVNSRTASSTSVSAPIWDVARSSARSIRFRPPGRPATKRRRYWPCNWGWLRSQKLSSAWEEYGNPIQQFTLARCVSERRHYRMTRAMGSRDEYWFYAQQCTDAAGRTANKAHREFHARNGGHAKALGDG
jgi:hypothetical protein